MSTTMIRQSPGKFSASPRRYEPCGETKVALAVTQTNQTLGRRPRAASVWLASNARWPPTDRQEPLSLCL